MTQKSLGHTELVWTCPSCTSKVPGLQKTCPACGSPQPPDVKFEQGKQELITDPAKLAAAKKGADIHCPFCGTRNAGDAVTCSQCGGDIKSGLRRETGQVIGAFSTETKPPKQMPCPNCATPNVETNTTCTACGALLHEAKPAEAPVPAVAAPAQPRNNRWLIFGAIGLAVLVIICLVFVISNFSKRSDLTAEVGSVNWLRLIPILELRDSNQSGWQEQIPAEAEVGRCEDRLYTTQDQPPASGNYQEVCGTPYTKDTGSGLGEVVQDCQYEIYLPYCQYTIQEWQVIDTIEQQGSDLNPQWPDLKSLPVHSARVIARKPLPLFSKPKRAPTLIPPAA